MHAGALKISGIAHYEVAVILTDLGFCTVLTIPKPILVLFEPVFEVKGAKEHDPFRVYGIQVLMSEGAALKKGVMIYPSHPKIQGEEDLS